MRIVPDDRECAVRFQQAECFSDECVVVAKVMDRVHAVDQVKGPALIRQVRPCAT